MRKLVGIEEVFEAVGLDESAHGRRGERIRRTEPGSLPT